MGMRDKLCPGQRKTDKMIKYDRKKSVNGCGTARIMHKKTVTPTRKTNPLVAAPTNTPKGSSFKLHSKRLAETPAVGSVNTKRKHSGDDSTLTKAPAHHCVCPLIVLASV